MACFRRPIWHFLKPKFSFSTSIRNLSSQKRFYKNVTVTGTNGQYDVNLDMKKLKTPLGKIFTVPSEPLAFAVAAEWSSQDKIVSLQNMHLTGLCNSALDNPTGKSIENIVDAIIPYLESDTICFQSEEPEELVHLQQTEWDPILSWFQKRHNIEITCSQDIMRGPVISAKAKDIIRRHLMSYNFWELIGLQFAADVLKSLVLTLATVDRHISAEKAVSLSRLEVEYQIAKWGNVEWGHDLDLLDLRSRFAAAILFVNFNSTSSSLKSKHFVI